MSDYESNNHGFLWFIVGAVVGASAALLYAPKSGRDTRNYISDQASEKKEAIASTGKEMLDKGKDLYDRGRQLADEAADLFERGRKMVQG